ncbi:MAG: methyltransferase, partial [Muribaculaceae bacterium]|nr:methyltransferase [Muribaculaceae bacterium]
MGTNPNRCSTFRFKQFEIENSASAMKVGTDGVLLGAWVTADNPQSILDIGAGSGLISIMLAQRFDTSLITGIEIDHAAAEEAQSNVSASPW